MAQSKGSILIELFNEAGFFINCNLGHMLFRASLEAYASLHTTD